MSDLKRSILDHFGSDFTPYYSRFLENLKPGGAGNLKALCPFHDDETPSLSIGIRDGRWNCKACGAKGDAFAFYGKKYGLSDFRSILNGISADFGISGNGAKPHQERPPKLIQRYTYTDTDGNPLFFKNRYEPKGFSISRPNGSGGYISGLGDVQPVLYNRPEVLSAEVVFIVEGEKDADNLNAKGITATTNFDGAGKWRDSYTQDLTGKAIVIIPDDDDPGKAHGQLVAKSLHGVAMSVRILQLPNPTSMKGFDVSDWLAAQSDENEAANQLLSMAGDAPEWTPPEEAPDPLPDIASAIQPASAFAMIEFRPRPPLIDPIIGCQTYHLWSGPEGVGKTLFAMSAALALTGWDTFGPWPVIERVPTLYIDGELTGGDIQERWSMLDPGWRNKDNLFIYSNMYATGELGLAPAILYCEEWRAKIYRVITHLGIRVVFIDNIMSLSDETDINKFELWAPVNSWALRLRAAGVTVIFLHHLGKSGDQLGTKAREINVDMSARFERPPNYEITMGADFVFSFKKNRLPVDKLPMIRPKRFSLKRNDHGDGYIWTFEKPEDEINFKVLTLLVDEKTSLRGIQTALGVNKNKVTRIKNRAIERGLVFEKDGALQWTQTGFTERDRWSK